jgi:hypothetical protein
MMSLFRASRGRICLNLAAIVVLIFGYLVFSAPTSYAWVTITYPPSDATLSGIVTVKASVTNDTASELLIDNLPSGAATSGSVSFQWRTSTVADGAHWLTVRAYKAGTQIADSSQTIMVSVLNNKAADMKKQFSTVPSSDPLPSGYWCSQVIPWENEPVSSNSTANNTMPTSTQLQAYAKNGYANNVYDGRWAYARVNGHYQGTTDMIMRWAACKWGIDEEVVRAQAIVEDYRWLQSIHGDKRTKYSQCVRDGFTSLWNFQCSYCCYQSWSIWQTKVYYDWPTWPMIRTSTPFAADYHFADQRVCMDGELMDYFADRPHYNGHSYAADIQGGDLNTILWGCIGYHYSGNWYDGNSSYGAIWYINHVRSALSTQSWKAEWPSMKWTD